MKIRWRQHEIIFVTLSGIFFAIQFFFGRMGDSHHQLHMRGIDDAGWGLVFTYFIKHYFIPQLGPLIVIYLLFLAVNLYIVPVLILRKRFIILTILFSIGIWLLLLLIFAAAYYQEDFYSIMGSSAQSLHIRSMQYGTSLSLATFIFYGVYVYLREFTIKAISKEGGNQPFRIMLTNHITGVLFTYLTIFFFFYIFRLTRSDGLGIFYFFFLLPSIVLCFINIYWLFPRQQRYKTPFKKFIWWLLVAPAFLAIFFWLAFVIGGGHAGAEFAMAIWFTLVFAVTPISWLIFVQQRQKLQSVLNLQKSLGKTSADLQFLRSQINPHFLFNALNTIYGTALQENAERTAEGVQKLGDMMRFMLEDNQQDRIPISKEIEYLTNYIALQKLRTQVSNDIDISFMERTSGCTHQIAPMLLIPFVENAFKHGISLKEKSWIKINISCDTENLHFDVYNSVHPKKDGDPERDRSGIGLENVKQRLTLIYPHQHELHIRSTNSEFFVHLTIKP
ncbi:MAG: histidine kinase [Chitinophagaceae bacterium]|nr:histidine kinase [Chitinophagaceae bacterium]